MGDRNYWSPGLTKRLKEKGLHLLAPYKSAKRESKKKRPRWLLNRRTRIETVLSHLVGRYRTKQVRAMDKWHLMSRWLRKVLSYTLPFYLCQQIGLSPLRFSELLTD